MNDKIKELMNAAGLSQKELAKKANITEASMSKYLSGDRTPRIDVVVKLANALGVSVNDLLLEGDDDQSPMVTASAALARCKDKLTADEKNKLIKILLED